MHNFDLELQSRPGFLDRTGFSSLSPPAPSLTPELKGLVVIILCSFLWHVFYRAVMLLPCLAMLSHVLKSPPRC